MCCGINHVLSFKNEAFGNDQTIAAATIKRQAFMNEKFGVIINCNADPGLEKEYLNQFRGLNLTFR